MLSISLLPILVLAAPTLAAPAPGMTIEEDFESYTPGQVLSNENRWSVWSGCTTCIGGTVDDSESSAGVQSVLFDRTAPAQQDALWDFGRHEAGKWTVSFDMLIPSGAGAYFNIQHEDANVSLNYLTEIYFRQDGVVYAADLDEDIGTYGREGWIDVTFVFDLDADQWEMRVDGTLMNTGQFSNTDNDGALSVQQINFYAAQYPGFRWHVDNLRVTGPPPLPPFFPTVLLPETTGPVLPHR
jgi:hypothetical protein